MKYLVLFLMLIPTVAMADVYVITTPEHSVYSLSEQDDAILPIGYTKTVIKGKSIASLALNPMTSLYDYNGGQFTLNQNRVTAKNKAEQETIAVKASAVAKFKVMGLTDQEIASILK